MPSVCSMFVLISLALGLAPEGIKMMNDTELAESSFSALLRGRAYRPPNNTPAVGSTVGEGFAPGFHGLRCPYCFGALHRSVGGFACADEGCGAFLPVRDGIVVARDVMSGDNQIAADFYNSRLWPKLKLWDGLFWLLNGGHKQRARSCCDICQKRRACDCSTWRSATAPIRVGCPRTGRSSAWMFRRRNSTPAGGGTPVAISNLVLGEAEQSAVS